MFGMELDSQVNEMNLFNHNWENSMDQSDPFESALSSIVSSPVNSHPGGTGIRTPVPGCHAGGESVVLKELIGRLGSICNSGEVSPESCIHGNNNTNNNSTNTSCYTTPLNSPPKLNLSMNHRNHHQLPMIPSDPGFVERAARFSCFGSAKEGEFQHVVESGKMSRVSSNQSFIKTGGSVSRLSMNLNSDNKEVDHSVEESSLSEQINISETGIKGRKRKVVSRGKLKEAQVDNKAVAESEKEESDAKRSKSDEEGNGIEPEKEKEKTEGNQKQTKENAKLPEPPKDYIHVRARRGQATDSHSLAERVRREKISERMKFLQDLVPGCNKVTGKAVMLDEIINYVQSLQRQVEFLSMKLATVNPRTDVNMEALLSKDTFHSRASLPNTMNHMEASAQPFYGMVNDGPENSLMAMMHHGSNMKLSQIDGFSEASAFWENDLQSVVQMGFGQNQGPSFHGTMGSGQMKVEL